MKPTPVTSNAELEAYIQKSVPPDRQQITRDIYALAEKLGIMEAHFIISVSTDGDDGLTVTSDLSQKGSDHLVSAILWDLKSNNLLPTFISQ